MSSPHGAVASMRLLMMHKKSWTIAVGALLTDLFFLCHCAVCHEGIVSLGLGLARLIGVPLLNDLASE